MTATWERLCRVDEVVPGVPVACVAGDAGQHRVCVVLRDDGEYVALLDRCPHRDAALSGGVVKGDALICPGHFWHFDLQTGERTDLPEQAATIYPTRVADGWVEAELPPPQPHLSMREWLLSHARKE